jgi:hypothetical protein
MRFGTVLLFVASFQLSGCAGGGSERLLTVSDSAGVRVAVNASGSMEAAEAWFLAEEPGIEVGKGLEPSLAFSQVTAIAPLRDDRVAVGISSRPQVYVFGWGGEHLATLGAPGRGAGEFSTVTSVVPLQPDSLAVWDQNRRRLSVFTDEGSYVREVDLRGLVPYSPMAAPGVDELSAFTYLLPSTPGTFMLLGVGALAPVGPGVQRVAVPSYRISTEGEVLEQTGPLPGLQTVGGAVPLPFAAKTYGVARGETLIVGTAEATEFRKYGPGGVIQAIVRWPDDDRTVGGPFLADWMEFLDASLAALPSEEREHFRAGFDGLPQLETFPAYDGIIGADNGEVWVGAYAGEYISAFPPRDDRVPERRWLVFEEDGALRATIMTPSGFQPHVVHDRRVWGVFRDERGCESVRAYEIER